MKEGDTLIRALVAGFTQHATAVTLAFPPSSSLALPAILSEECGNAVRPRMEGRRKWDQGGERIKGTG